MPFYLHVSFVLLRGESVTIACLEWYTSLGGIGMKVWNGDWIVIVLPILWVRGGVWSAVYQWFTRPSS